LLSDCPPSVRKEAARDKLMKLFGIAALALCSALQRFDRVIRCRLINIRDVQWF
jgi:hypothetical protein